MLRRRLQSLQLLQQAGGSWWGSRSTTAACAGLQAASSTSSSTASSSTRNGSSSWRRCYAANAAACEPTEAAALKQAAHELGLDAVPLQQLKELMVTGQQQVGRDSVTVVSRGTANTRKLVWGDLPGYHALLEQLAVTPQVYDLPKAPALDAGQWVNTHMKEVGLGMEPRGDFYVWRAWAAANLPPDQHATMLAMSEVMGDETSRAALVKQSQHELARLWDWQHRRAALGLSPDLPASAAAAGGSARPAPAGAAAAAPAAAAGGSMPPPPPRIDADAAAAVAALDALGEREQVPEPSASSPSDVSDADEDAQRSAGERSESEDDAAVPTNLLEVLARAEEQQQAQDDSAAAASTATAAAADVDSAAAAAAAAEALLGGGMSSSSARLAAWGVPLLEDVVDEAAQSQHPVLRKWASQPSAHAFALKQVREKLERGRTTAERGKNRYMAGVPVRQYNPVGDDDDTFLPVKPYGSKHVAAALADPNATRPVNPTKVAAQAAAVAAAARRAAAAAAAAATTTPSSPEGLAAAALAQGGGAGKGSFPDAGLSSVEDMAAWSSMPLLDRSLLHEEEIKQAAEKLAGRRQKQEPWQLLSDGYIFDLEQRPPTPALDLLTSYLEVRYADVLLRKDSVQTLQRQLALRSLQDSGAGRLSELLEQPPAALTAGRTLSPQERQAVSDTLDGLLSSKQYEGYRQAVLQLYCDGLITWGELQECWAAAQTGQELTAAAEAPVDGLADDRQRLFGFLSGAHQLQDLSTAASQHSSPADEAAARAAWQEAGSKLQANWAAAAGSSSSSSSDGGKWWAGEPVSYEEAAATWQQLLTLAGQTNGPRFHQVLLQATGSGGSDADALHQQLRHLQAALERATGLPGSSLEAVKSFDSSGSSVSELEAQLQLLFAAPSLEQLMQQHWAQVAKEELGQQPDSSSSSSPDAAAAAAPSWGQLWSLLQQLTHNNSQQQQHEAAAAAGAAGEPDAAALFERHLRDADGVALTPPPYPGARRLLRWEQRMVLHAASGEAVLPAELKVKLSVSAAELAQETGLSSRALDYMLAVAGSRYNVATGVLTIACDRFPTREENRRWCLEALHKLLQAAQGRCPSASFALDSSSVLGPARGAGQLGA